MNVFTGNFVAGFLRPRLLALVHEETRRPNREVNGLTSALLWGPRDLQASTATDLTARRFTEGRPDRFRRLAIDWESALPEPHITLATSLTRTCNVDMRAEWGSWSWMRVLRGSFSFKIFLSLSTGSWTFKEMTPLSYSISMYQEKPEREMQMFVNSFK